MPNIYFLVLIQQKIFLRKVLNPFTFCIYLYLCFPLLDEPYIPVCIYSDIFLQLFHMYMIHTCPYMSALAVLNIFMQFIVYRVPGPATHQPDEFSWVPEYSVFKCSNIQVLGVECPENLKLYKAFHLYLCPLCSHAPMAFPVPLLRTFPQLSGFRRVCHLDNAQSILSQGGPGIPADPQSLSAFSSKRIPTRGSLRCPFFPGPRARRPVHLSLQSLQSRISPTQTDSPCVTAAFPGAFLELASPRSYPAIHSIGTGEQGSRSVSVESAVSGMGADTLDSVTHQFNIGIGIGDVSSINTALADLHTTVQLP